MATKTEPAAPTRKKRTISKLWIIILSPVLLVLMISVAAFWHHYHLESQIEAELQKVRDAGHPTTADDLAKLYALPKGAPDRTSEWLAVIRQMKLFTDDPQYSGLPIIGTGEGNLQLGGEPWPDQAVIDQLMAEAEPSFAELIELSRSPGAVRFPRDFNNGFGMLLPNVQELRNLARMLSIRARWQIRQGDSAGAVESLIAMRGVADTVQHDPIVISHLVRVAITSMMLNDILELMPHADWNEDQLRQLQQAILTGDTFHNDLQLAWHGERALGNVAFTDPSGLGNEIPATFALTRRADQLYYLETFDRMITASEESFAEGQAELLAIEAEMQDQTGIARLRHAMSIMILPGMSNIHFASGRGDANQRIVATLIAARRYRLTHGKWPTKIGDLVPEFLESVAVDPFDGQSLRFANNATAIVVWSVAKDGVDDGGQTNPQSGNMEPDIVYRLEKFD